MKKIFRSVLFLSVLAFVSCADELDINDNPNTPVEITPGLALASAEASLATVVGGELTNLGGMYAQYQTQSPSASQYELMDSNNLNAAYSDRFWQELYAGCLNDLEFVLTNSGNTSDQLIATSLKAYTFQLLVDLFGDVPYTEALQGGANITPALTSGEDIYADLILKLDTAIAAYNANPEESTVGTQDNVYGGDGDKWVQFANTLKLRMYIRMAYTPQANPAAVTALLAENNFITQDASFSNFNETLDKTNPFYGVQLSNQGSGLGDVNNIASNSLLQFYIANGDQRQGLVYRPDARPIVNKIPQDGPLTYTSIAQGTGNNFNDTAKDYAKPNVYPRLPVFFITVAESNFLQAEALIRYAGGAGAKAKYDAGVIASFTTYAVNFFADDSTLNDVYEKTDDDKIYGAIYTDVQGIAFANAFIAPGGNYEYVDAGSVEGNVRQVMIQKWAALAFVNNIESYIETTRTKYPEVVPVGTEDHSIGNRVPSEISVLSGTQMPTILFYPQNEVNRNPNVQQRSSVIEKVWWDQK